MVKLGLAALTLAALVVGCPSPALPPEPPVVETVSAERVCARLAELECPEADDANRCVEGVRRMQRLVRLDTACVADARDVEAVRACGVRCRL